MAMSIFGRTAEVEVDRKPTVSQMVNFLKEADSAGADTLVVMRGEAGHQLAKGLFGFRGWKLDIAPGGGHTLNSTTTQTVCERFNENVLGLRHA